MTHLECGEKEEKRQTMAKDLDYSPFVPVSELPGGD